MAKKVTIYDIAKALGVSTATVNRALNNKPEVSPATRQKVLSAAEEMGFIINHAAKSLARPEIHIDFIIHNHVPVFHDEITRGVRRAFMELRDFRVTGEVCVFSGEAYMVRQEYLSKLRELETLRHEGLLMLTPPDTRGLHDAVQRIAQTGTRIAMVNSDLPGSCQLFTYRQNAAQAGRMAAELLSWFAPSGLVAVFTGGRDVTDHANSIGGFAQEAQRRGMRLVAVSENHDDPGFAAYNTEQFFREHPEVEGLYINTANSVAVCQRLEALGLAGKVRVVASDVFPELIELMRRDVVHATIFQDPFRQGQQAAKTLYRCIAEGETPPAEILISPRVVLRSNLPEFSFLDHLTDAR